MTVRPMIWGLVERWLIRRVPARALDAVLGDLEHDYARRLATTGRLAAAAWLWREARAIARAYRWHRRDHSRPRGAMMETTLQDLRSAVRLFGRRPGLTTAAVLTLVLGLGANLTVFAVAHAVLFPDLPYPAADRIVEIYEARAGEQGSKFTRPGLIRAWQANSQDFTAIAAYTFRGGMTLSGGGREAVRLNAYNTTPELFDVMQVRPLLGRTLTEDDAQPGVRPVVVSYGVWQSVLGGDPEAAGRTLELDGESWTVVGVMPEGVAFPGSHDVDLWTPLVLPEALWNNTRPVFLSAIGRVRPGVTVGSAEAALASVTASVLDSAERRFTARLVDFRHALTANVRAALLALQAVALLVLVIAAVNIANLLLASTTARRRELSVRASLGAGRWRIARQLLMEGLVLASAGGAAALLAAWWLGPALLASYPSAVPIFQPVSLGPAELAVAGGLILLTTAVISVAPAVLSARTDLRAGLADTAQGTGSRGLRWLRSSLVASQVALAVVLLVGGGLLVRSYRTLTAQSLGFDPARTLVGELSLPEARYADRAARRAFVHGLIERLEAQPGVQEAAASTLLPFGGGSAGHGVDVESPRGEPVGVSTRVQVVTPGFFEAVGIAMVRGRPTVAGDRDAGAPVAVVNEAFARQVDPSGDVVGRRFFRRGMPDEVPTTIVGVVADARIQYGRAIGPELYHPSGTGDIKGFYLVIRSAGGPAPSMAMVLDVIRALDPDLPFERPRAYTAMIAASVGAERFNTVMLATMAALATLLAAVGIAGVMLHVGRLRTREIGIRLALGARVSQVQRLMVRQGLRPLVAGLAAGSLAAWWLAGLLESQLFEVAPHDGLTFVVAPALFFIVGLATCWWPTVRATRVDPVMTLRAE